MVARSNLITSLARVRYRIAQALIYLRPRRSNEVDTRLTGLLRPEEFVLVERLSPADRAHHLDVYDRLVGSGCAERDVLMAALLHDVGKVDGDARVGLVHRTLAVLLDAVSPSLLPSLASAKGARWRRALYLTRMHPAVGARYAREAGCSERVLWLIAHHHERGNDDEELLQLQRADDGVDV